MSLLKKLALTIFMMFTMLVAAPSVIAQEAPTQTLTDVIALAEETISAMKAGEADDKVLALLKETKQASKSIVISGPADIPRSKANMKIKKSRRAFRKGEKEKAIKLAEKGLDLYKKAKAKHFD
jgi:hypothetical protein